MIPDDLLERAARRFQQLSDPTRLRLLSVLNQHGSLNVSSIADMSGVSVANTSQHLNRLAQAGLVSRDRQGNSIFYEISDPSLGPLCDLVCTSILEQRHTG